MARLSHDQYKQIITQFNWNNLNKEITGNVLRQFINNILDSVAEMKLLDGTTIENAIQQLRNRLGGGTGGGNDFSEQFKFINDVVWLNLHYITANDDDSDVNIPDEPEEPDEPGEPVDPLDPEDFVVKINPVFLGQLESGSIEDLEITVERSPHDPLFDVYTLKFINAVIFNPASLHPYINIEPLYVDIPKMGEIWPDLYDENGDYYRIISSFRINSVFSSSLNQQPNDPELRVHGILHPLPGGGYSSYPFLNVFNNPDPVWVSIMRTAPWRYSGYNSFVLRMGTYNTVIPAGSEIYWRHIRASRQNS